MGKKDFEKFNSYTNLLTGDFDIEKYSKDKKTIADTLCTNFLDKMQSAFKWTGLPETIPQKWLEVMLMRCGYCVVAEVDGNLYALWGGLGGELDEYYQPTLCTVANPYLNLSAIYEIKDDKDAVLVSNDTLRRGIVPIIGKYAGLLAENTITMRIADIMARITNIMSASDDSTIQSALEYLKQMEDGQLGVIAESPFLEDLKVQVGASQAHTQITDLIEMEQYLKASLYNELGLQANYNMKRESINSAESQLNNDMMRPYLDNMLQMRREAAEHINARFGTDISVDFDGVWKEKRESMQMAVQSETQEEQPEDPVVKDESDVVKEESTEQQEEQEEKQEETEGPNIDIDIEVNANGNQGESEIREDISCEGDTDKPERDEAERLDNGDESRDDDPS